MKARLVRFSSMVVASLSLLAALATVAHAVDPVTMEVASPMVMTPKPLSIMARVGRWFPVAVTLSNTGDAVQGRLTLTLRGELDGRTPNSEFYTDVDLPANAARKRVWLYARLERDDARNMEIRFQGRGFKALRVSGQLVVLEPQTRSVLTISDFDEKLNYLKELRGGGLDIAEERQPGVNYQGMQGGVPQAANTTALIATMGAPREMVPPRWVGLETADVIVLHDFPHTSLTPEQLAALRGYVAGGGTLLALGGSDWQRLAQSPLADLWPMVPTSSSTASGSEVQYLVSRYVRVARPTAGDRLGGAAVLMTRGTLRPDTADAESGSPSPLLLRRNVGAGQVLLLTVDPTKPPFMGWSGNTGLWRAVFSQSQRAPRMETIDIRSDQNYYSPYGQPAGMLLGTGADASLTSSLLQALASAKQLKTPPVSFIAWFLALYVFFLVPVNYCVLRYFDKRELAWVTIPVIVVAFSVMSYAAALKIKGNAILMRQANIVQSSQGSPLARADAMLWLFSPRKTTYDVSSTQGQMALGDYVDSENANSSVGTIFQPDESKAFTLEDAAINMWDSRTFVGSSVVNMGNGIDLKQEGDRVVVQNGTDRDLKGALIISSSRLITIGDLRKGASAAAVAADSINAMPAHLVEKLATKSRVEDLLKGEERENFRGISRALLHNAISSKYATSRGGSMLIAWSDQPAAPMTIGYDDTRSGNLSLFVVRLQSNALLQKLVSQPLPSSNPAVGKAPAGAGTGTPRGRGAAPGAP